MDYFKDVLIRSGVTLEEDDGPNELEFEHSLVVNKIETNLKNDKGSQNNVKDFLTGLKDYCKHEELFIKALQSSSYKSKRREASLIRILLEISCLQEETIDLLCGQLQLKCENIEEVWVKLILDALQLLPFFSNPKKLTESILEIIEMASLEVQIEIINILFNIIPQCEKDDASKLLIKLLSDNVELSGAIISTLNTSDEARATILEYITKRMLVNARYFKTYPILIEFVFCTKKEQLLDVFGKVRDALDLLMMTNSPDLVDTKVITFEKIYSSLNANRFLFDVIISWMSTNKNPIDHKGIDLILMLALLSKLKIKEKLVEAAIIKKFKQGTFNEKLLDSMFEHYFTAQIFADFFPDMMKLFCNFLITDNVNLRESGSAAVKLLFMHPLTTISQRQELLFNLLPKVQRNDTKYVDVILDLIRYLVAESTQKNYFAQLIGLLGMLQVFNLSSTKRIFDILANLSFKANESYSNLNDELRMVIRKYIASADMNAKRKGIIGGIILIKYMIYKDVDEVSTIESHDDSTISITDLPGEPKEAARLLTLVLDHCERPDLLNLCYDCLSEMIIESDFIDRNFLLWFAETKVAQFQDVFVVETVPHISGIDLCVKYQLNSQDDADDITINIGGLTYNAPNGNILSLSSTFRLIRLLHLKQCNGELVEIDALVGCGIIMPDIENFSSYDSDEIEYFADCLLHCINWFRELISAFVTQKARRIKERVLARLDKLISLQKLFFEIMNEIPYHKLPDIHYITQNKNTAKAGNMPPPKKFKSAAKVNVTTTSTQLSTQRPQTSKSGTSRNKFTGSVTFRELDTDVISLLRYPIRLNDENMTATQAQLLNVRQFHFLLQEFIDKFKTKQSIKLVLDAQKLLPSIHNQFTILINKITDEFTEVNGDLKLTTNATLELYYLIYSWKDFARGTYQTVLTECLKVHQSSISQYPTLTVLIIDFVKNLNSYTEKCYYLPSAVHILDIMEALNGFNVREISKNIFKTSEKLLKHRWCDLQGKPETGRASHENIDKLLRHYFKKRKVSDLFKLVTDLQDDIKEMQTSNCLALFAAINKSNFYLLFRNICQSLATQISSEIDQLTNTEHLALWHTTALTMEGLMLIAKSQESKNNYSIFLKKSISILKTFISHGIPILEITMRSHPNEVQTILKTMQSSTRFLHYLCCQSKALRDQGIIKDIPLLKSVLETMIYRVKAALIANNCSEAFYIGRLKNINIYGEEILSQTTVGEEEEELSLGEEDNEDEDSTTDKDFSSASASNIID